MSPPRLQCCLTSFEALIRMLLHRDACHSAGAFMHVNSSPMIFPPVLSPKVPYACDHAYARAGDETR